MYPGTYPGVASAPWRDNRQFVLGAGITSALLTLLGSLVRSISLVSVIGWILVIVAQYRLVQAHEYLGRPNTQWGRGWAIGGRLIPLANTVIPALQLSELWRGSDPENEFNEPAWKYRDGTPLTSVLIAVNVVGGLIGWFMLFFVFDRVMQLVRDNQSNTRGGPTQAEIHAAIHLATGTRVLAALFSLASIAITTWLFVRIAERQQASFLRCSQNYVPPPPAAPYVAAPGWYADPWQRFAFRWHDGRAWTALVSANGQNAYDEAPLQQPPPPSSPPPPTNTW